MNDPASSKSKSHTTAATGGDEDGKELAPARLRASKLSSADREQMIVRSAVTYFAKHGFQGNTRDLARELGITQSLLYRYFPSKQALFDRVYAEVYLSRWNPFWEEMIQDRSRPIELRLMTYYQDYAKSMLQSEWVRLLVFAGLERAGINEKLFGLLRAKIYEPVVRECYAAWGVEGATYDMDEETELVWALHASIFYIGMRKWIYASKVPRDLHETISALVESFMHGMRVRVQARQPGAPASKKAPKARKGADTTPFISA